MAPRLRVAIDTNVLLSGLLWRGTPGSYPSGSEFLEVYLRRAARRLQQQKPDLYLKLLLYITAPE